uniref:DUF4371 domain-containing protein n=1 Tax=Stegastes partitus TaxID=144197 RepID=A0A3B5BDA7_9TELE
MSLTGQKHKIDNENRRFNTAWTEKYVFILPQRLNSKHHVEKHRAFGTACPEGTEERATKVHLQHKRGPRKKRPFTDAETVRDCMIAILDEVIHNDKIKASVTSAVKSSGNISHRCVCVFVFAALLSDLKKVEVVSIPVDESTERLDTAQLGVYVCVYDAGHRCFHGELLCLLPLKGHTAGEVFFDKIFFQDNGLDKTRVCMLVTDGAPSMTGKVTLHCIVHQALLCAKLNRHFKSVMDDVMATVNFIHATSSLQHRVFRQLCLSKGKSLERFCALKEEITVFLHDSKQKKAEAHLNRIMDTDFMADVCFLSDLFTHLNRLNLGLQGKEKTIIDLEEQTHAFPAKLELFAADLSSGRMLHFPTLHKCITPTAPVTAAMTDLVAKLKDNVAIPKPVTVFSHMNAIKSNLRCSTTDSTLHHCLRIALTSYEPNVPAIVQNKTLVCSLQQR